ncbi:YdiU family protein [Xanthomonas campestris pv. paulliniae]|uniref:protein adenylyltransferase SelO family protein n=1 Tax=Xanthomonas euvesicatoria TaxID=456327 RepID=UPI001C467A16|nr:protein adenylyltransferase SelO family protein [Xanthomonas euvesicatoria]MBV6845777.1 YdiU family protein [Xanthomonas campestris pv. paulliniae]
MNNIFKNVAPSSAQLHQLSEHLLVPFSTKKLPSARIVWMNRNWMRMRGMNLSSPSVRAELSSWLLSEYAVSSNVAEVGKDEVEASTAFYADRYGASEGCLHGGSGRCGINGMFNAKGIGRTPLVSPGVDWSHSHGLLTLCDAIREAIASEILSREMPHGVIPVVAIIDTGLDLPMGQGEFPARCAILIRPNFLRVAHFERSIYFGTRGFEGSDQWADEHRVREMYLSIERAYSKESIDAERALVETFTRIVSQVGHSQAHRIWNGRPGSDSFAIDGSFLDFGNFRALPDWRCADDGNGQIFGRDLVELIKLSDSLGHYLSKHCGSGSIRPLISPQAIKGDLKAAFIHGCLVGIGLPSSSQPAIAMAGAIYDAFCAQQRIRHRLDMAPESLINTAARGSFRNYIGLISAPFIDDVVEDLSDFARRDSWRHSCVTDLKDAISAQLGRWLEPREDLFYMNSKLATQSKIKEAMAADNPEYLLTDFIARKVTLGRRVWPDLSSNKVPVGYSLTRDSELRCYFDLREGGFISTLTGDISTRQLKWFGAGQNDRLEDGSFQIRTASCPIPVKSPAQTMSHKIFFEAAEAVGKFNA